MNPQTHEGEARMGRPTVWIVVPTIDECQSLAYLIPQLMRLDPEWKVVVVDDGSNDGSRALLRQLSKGEERLHPLFRDRKGLGSALRDGMSYALGRGATCVVTMDADLSHDPESIESLLAADADIVLGSRYTAGGGIVGWPRRRKVISFMANRLSRFSLGTTERDLTTGFRAYSRRMAELILQESVSRGYGFQVEVVNIARKHSMDITEVPITFRERLYGESKLGSSREGAGLFRMLATRTPLKLFLIVGLIGALVNEVLLISLVGVASFHYLVAGLVAVEGGVVSSFVLNEKWTFRGRPRQGSWSTRLSRYHAAVFGGLLLNVLVLFILTEYANILYLLSNIFGMGTAFSWNYFLSNFLVRRL